MELNQKQSNKSIQLPSNEVVSIKECEPYLSKFNLSDTHKSVMKNNLVGMIDSALDTYLEGFK